MNREVEIAILWMNANKLTINAAKSNALVIILKIRENLTTPSLNQKFIASSKKKKKKRVNVKVREHWKTLQFLSQDAPKQFSNFKKTNSETG